MRVKILFTTIVLAGFFICFSSALAQGTSAPATAIKDNGPVLELIYPIIPGEITTETMNEGLPQYIRYIFGLAMVLIGLIIFGVLLYNGLLWFTSAGNADKLKRAKDGISGAFLGAIILFSAYIIFKTINPQLTALKLENPDAVEPAVIPGVYLCNYNATNAPGAIAAYMNGSPEEKIQAARDLKAVMKNDKGGCFRVNSSGNLDYIFHPVDITNSQSYTGTWGLMPGNGDYKVTLQGSMFTIPRKEITYDPETGKNKNVWVYEYGIIFHEKDNHRGQCQLAAYDTLQTIALQPSLRFSAKSITLFKLPETEPDPHKAPLTLYECVNQIDAGKSLCPQTVTGSPKKREISLGFNDYTMANLPISVLTKISTVDNLQPLGDNNTKSLTIDPEGAYIAVLFSEDKFAGQCQIFKKSDNNLNDDPIGQCSASGSACNNVINGGVATESQITNACMSCVKSVILIKGGAL